VKVETLMTTGVRTVTPETPLKEVAAILAEEGISGLPVCDPSGNVLGVVSETDILYKEQPHRAARLEWLLSPDAQARALKHSARTAGEAMSSPAVTIAPHRPVSEAARLMLERGVNRLPVVRNGTLVGIVTRADLVRAFTRTDAQIAEEIREEVLRGALWIDPSTVSVEVVDGAVTLGGRLERRSDVQVLLALTERVPGVVSVRSGLTWNLDDGKRAFAPF
jgi:CBS domain-containing protein